MTRLGSERRLVFRVLGYWQELRGELSLPQAVDLVPAVFSEDWEHCAILRRKGTGRYFVSEIGVYLDPADHPMTGKLIEDCPPNSLLRAALAPLPQVFDKRVPVSAGGELMIGDNVMLYRCIVLPAADDGGEIDGLLVCANYRIVPRERPVTELTA
jgi:hypothetical protein